MLPVSTGNTIKMAIINLGSVVREREGSIRRELSQAQLKPTSLDIGLLELTTVSCPSLLHLPDGTVEKNKGTVTRISHTPPTSPFLPNPEIRTRRSVFRNDLFLHVHGLFLLAMCGSQPVSFKCQTSENLFIKMKIQMC